MKVNRDKISSLQGPTRGLVEIHDYLRSKGDPNPEEVAYYTVKKEIINGKSKFTPKSPFYPHMYQDERQQLNSVINEIVEKSNGERNAEDVFTFFARAYFTGNMKPLSSMIHENFGPGKMKEMLHW